MPVALLLRFAPFAAIVFMGAYIMVLKANVETLETEKAVLAGNQARLETAIEDQNERIESYVAEVAAQQTEIRYEQDRANKAEKARDTEVARINSWRNTLANEIGDRPKVVARTAGLAFRRVLRSIEESTTPSGSEDGGDTGTEVSPGPTGPDNRTTD